MSQLAGPGAPAQPGSADLANQVAQQTQQIQKALENLSAMVPEVQSLIDPLRMAVGRWLQKGAVPPMPEGLSTPSTPGALVSGPQATAPMGA